MRSVRASWHWKPEFPRDTRDPYIHRLALHEHRLYGAAGGTDRHRPEMAPSAMSFTPAPDANAPPPVDSWMIPSLLLSVSPFSTAFAVVSDVTLMAG
jgi:hypothetical protein